LKHVTIVPEDAIERGPNGLYAFVVGDDNKVAMRDVKLGPEGAGQAVVLQGLSPGQKVVTAGQYRLTPGALVQPTEGGSAVTAQNAPPGAP
jgi:membrane fusion protein, multidrug efflux system